MLRTAIALVLMVCAGSLPAAAKTVKTDTILVAPTVADPNAASIPDEDLPDATGGETGDMEENLPIIDEELQPIGKSPNAPTEVPQVFYDRSSLPPLVARMHDQLMDAAKSGDMDKLRMVLESNEVPPTLSLTEIGDPIEFLKGVSGDQDGLEVLAILADTLDAGFIHVDEGTPQEMYIWPYFARYPFASLTKEQKVEMFRLITATDFAEMEAYGVWLFYRVGIGKDGTLHYFVAGE
ncbi:hypothetical protein [Roseibium suaedae]|uniref:Uncharacterized protein n=1 Tax=Roseibium suaedae TaxID=735517 RepID=A0A1M7B4B7_9HYPH|nr:hypothetical protein [Roseibium suaedae]SHL49716.1 hypothetical protein SAMN05444272_0724 [Roseibium suaedae]